MLKASTASHGPHADLHKHGFMLDVISRPETCLKRMHHFYNQSQCSSSSSDIVCFIPHICLSCQSQHLHYPQFSFIANSWDSVMFCRLWLMKPGAAGPQQRWRVGCTGSCFPGATSPHRLIFKVHYRLLTQETPLRNITLWSFFFKYINSGQFQNNQVGLLFTCRTQEEACSRYWLHFLF